MSRSQVASWKPAELPEKLQAFAVPCPNCPPLREAAKALVARMNDSARDLFLKYQGNPLSWHGLEVQCNRCGDTGWLFDQAAVEILNALAEVTRSPAISPEPEQAERKIIEVLDDTGDPL